MTSGRYGDAHEHCHRTLHRRSPQFASCAAVAGGISVAYLRRRARGRVPAQKFRREPAALAREPVSRNPHRHRIRSDGRDGPRTATRSHSQPHSDHRHHSDPADRSDVQFLGATPPDSRASHHRHHDHIWLERGGHPNHCLAGRQFAAYPVSDPQHCVHLLHERADFLSRGRSQRHRAAGLPCRRHRAGIAGP